MSFPVYSTATETAAIQRTLRVLGRSRNPGRLIASAGVFNCRKVAGSSTWSQHAYGNAADLFPAALTSDKRKEYGLPTTDAELANIANGVVWQATHRTWANRGRPVPVAQVIDHDNRRIWEPGTGWQTYTGTTGAHVHVSGRPMRSGTPACAT